MDPNQNQPTQAPQSASGYFAQSEFDPNAQSTGSRFKKWWDGFQYYLRQIWPYIYSLINFIVYEIIKVLRGIVRMAMEQFKG
ncbi:MAG: hypothetical protein ACM3IJ_06030 [Candidatus Levyibacteriota bacterium]